MTTAQLKRELPTRIGAPTINVISFPNDHSHIFSTARSAPSIRSFWLNKSAQVYPVTESSGNTISEADISVAFLASSIILSALASGLPTITSGTAVATRKNPRLNREKDVSIIFIQTLWVKLSSKKLITLLSLEETVKLYYKVRNNFVKNGVVRKKVRL